MTTNTIEVSYHSQFVDEMPNYLEIADWFDGRKKNVIKYLIRHQSESGNTPEAMNAWNSRRARTTNENEMKPAIKIHVGHLAQPIDWGEFANNAKLEAVLADVSGQKETPQKMMQRQLEAYLQFGRIAVYVEGPDLKSSGAEETLDDVNASNTHSFQVLFDARAIRNWKRFTSGPLRGELSEVLLARGAYKQDNKNGERLDLFTVEPGNNFARTELFIESGAASGDSTIVKAEVLAVHQGSLPRIPVIIIGDGLATTVTADAAEKHHALFNQVSILDSINYYQGFKWSLITGATAEEIKARSEFQVTLIANEAAGVHTVDAGDPTAIATRIEGIRYRLRRLMMFDMNALTNDETKMVQSAESKDHDVQARKEVYNSILDIFQNMLTDVYKLHAIYEGATELADNTQLVISIGRDFKLSDPMLELARRGVTFSQAEQMKAQLTRKEIFRLNVQATVETDAETMKTLMDEIDAMPDVFPEAQFALPSLTAQGGVLSDIV